MVQGREIIPHAAWQLRGDFKIPVGVGALKGFSVLACLCIWLGGIKTDSTELDLDPGCRGLFSGPMYPRTPLPRPLFAVLATRADREFSVCKIQTNT